MTTKTEENPLSKFDAPTLKGMQAGALGTATAFLPTNMGEAMELAKLMASSKFVPPHLRGVPGDCLAVVMQSTRWEMDPFAVANKSYFVNDRMAYEAQLVNAVVNARAPLDGRLQIEWEGEGAALVCKVIGRIKGDERDKIVTQAIAEIKTQNSPLWKSSPRQQLAYYTTRMWARLYVPEVLMGVYTEDEIKDMGVLEPDADGEYRPAPRRPQRKDYTDADLAAAGHVDPAKQYAEHMGATMIDPETGEVYEDETEDENTESPAGQEAAEVAAEATEEAPADGAAKSSKAGGGTSGEDLEAFPKVVAVTDLAGWHAVAVRNVKRMDADQIAAFKVQYAGVLAKLAEHKTDLANGLDDLIADRVDALSMEEAAA